MFMVASISGPILGGFLTEYLHWTLIFWINLPVGLVALVVADRALRKLPRHDHPHSLDVLGALLLVGAALSLMLAMTWGGTRYPWTSLPILSLLLASIALWSAFALRLRTAAEPFIPLAILREPIAGVVCLVGFCSIGVVIGLSIYLPVYLELVLGLSPSGSGTVLIVFSLQRRLDRLPPGRLTMWVTGYKRVPIVGLALGILMLTWLAVKPSGLTQWQVAMLFAVGGAGLGALYPMTTINHAKCSCSASTWYRHRDIEFSRLLGGSIIVAAFGAILIGGIDAGGKGLTLEMLTREAPSRVPIFPVCSDGYSSLAQYFLRLGFSRCSR